MGDQRLSSKVAVVTGASSGLGRDIALTLARHGASTVCCDLQEAPRSGGFETDAAATHDAITEEGGHAAFVQCDVTAASDMAAVVKAAVDLFGGIDIMVNNAGIWTGWHTIVDETEEQFDSTLAVNCKGVWLGSKYAMAQMVEQDRGGRIINIASLAGLQGLEREPAYCASKGAVVNLTRQLALDFGSAGITVNAICPGFMETALSRPLLGKNPAHALVPAGRFGTGEDVAKAALFLSSDDAAYVNGSTLVVDGGYTAR